MYKRITGLIATTLLLVLLAPSAALTAASDAGVIQGKLVNQTADSTSSLADVEITLTTTEGDKELGTETTNTDASGGFSFAGLSTDSAYTYQVKLTYQETEYYSEQLSFGGEETSRSVELVVYDSTDSDESVEVSNAHTVVYVGDGTLEITEYYLLANYTDRSYIGYGDITATGKRRTVDFPLPGKFSELQYAGDLMECCVLKGNGVFTDTMPVPPGVREIVFSYRVDYSGNTYDLSRKTSLPTTSYDLLIQGDSGQVDSAQLVSQASVTLDGMPFQRYSSQNLARGTAISATISGLPGNQNTVIWASALSAIILLVVAFVYLRKRNRLQPAQALATGTFEQRRRALLTGIVRLDDEFEAGLIQEDAYKKQRAARKAELLNLMRNSRPDENRR